VNVTDVPEQMLLALAAIVTTGVTSVLTSIVIVFEVAGLPVTHVSSEVNTQVTWSLFAGTYEYEGLSLPKLAPFTFHW
jgi:hypothetical protein